MSTYSSWNEFFKKKNDNTVVISDRKNPLCDVDDFENAYRKKYGILLDHHALKLTKLYGSEKAWVLIEQNINALNADMKQAADLKKARQEFECHFHSIPDNVQIPF